MPKFSIYALTEPDDETIVRYVGQTTVPLQVRLDDHLLGRGGSARARWIRERTSRGLTPKIALLEVVTGVRRDAYAAEQRWIRHYRGLGHNLLNVP